MKTILIILLCSLTSLTSKAQTFSEWFRQGSTQKKYLAEQIAALQAYIGFAKKGYDIAHEGLTTIGNIKNGDFNLHSLYFGSLKAVNPEIVHYPRIKDILDLQQAAFQTAGKSKRQITESGVFTPGQRTYLFSVYDKFSVDCNRTLTDLEAVTTPGKLEMKDDERLKRIDELYATSQKQYGFCKSFSDQLSILALQKERATKEDKLIMSLYDLKN